MVLDELFTLALQGADRAYVPYSHWPVGAAVLGEDGRVFVGCNVENVSYGLTCCAERTSLFKMISEGCRRFTAMAVVSGDDCTGFPCGACRQVLAEFAAGPSTPVLVAGRSGSRRTLTVAELLPYAFKKETLLHE